MCTRSFSTTTCAHVHPSLGAGVTSDGLCAPPFWECSGVTKGLPCKGRPAPQLHPSPTLTHFCRRRMDAPTLRCGSRTRGSRAAPGQLRSQRHTPWPGLPTPPSCLHYSPCRMDGNPNLFLLQPSSDTAMRRARWATRGGTCPSVFDLLLPCPRTILQDTSETRNDGSLQTRTSVSRKTAELLALTLPRDKGQSHPGRPRSDWFGTFH